MSNVNSKRIRFVVRPDGTTTSLYSPEAEKYLEFTGGHVEAPKRASYVDTWEYLRESTRDILRKDGRASRGLLRDWWADMTPSDGPVLGPFRTHADGISAELAWLRDNHIT